MSPDKYKEYIKNPTIKISDKGNEVLNEFYFIVPAHKNGSKEGIYNPATAIHYMKNRRNRPSNNDISWALFAEAFAKYQLERKYGLLCIVMRNMASQLYKEKKYRESLNYYLQIFIVELSGLNNGDYISTPEYIFISPNTGDNILRIMNILEIDKNQLRDEFRNSWIKINKILPFHYLDQETAFQCLLASFDDQVEFISEAINKAYRNIDKSVIEKKYNLRFLDFHITDSTDNKSSKNNVKAETSVGCFTQIMFLLSVVSLLGFWINFIL